MAPRPVLTSPARKIVQNAPKISSGDQFQGHVVAISRSRPKRTYVKKDGVIAGKFGSLDFEAILYFGLGLPSPGLARL